MYYNAVTTMKHIVTFCQSKLYFKITTTRKKTTTKNQANQTKHNMNDNHIICQIVTKIEICFNIQIQTSVDGLNFSLVYKKLNTFVLSSQDIYSILEFFTLWQSK
jgi:hypothetical protein